VLNAADPRVEALAELCDGEVLLYAEDGSLPAMVAHRAAGGRTVQVNRGRLVLSRGGEDSVLCHAATLSDACRLPIGPMLAASAVAWAMGLSPDLIVAGLKTFTPSEETSHGR
jgi:cyanophycin synthetase